MIFPTRIIFDSELLNNSKKTKIYKGNIIQGCVSYVLPTNNENYDLEDVFSLVISGLTEGNIVHVENIVKNVNNAFCGDKETDGFIHFKAYLVKKILSPEKFVYVVKVSPFTYLLGAEDKSGNRKKFEYPLVPLRSEVVLQEIRGEGNDKEAIFVNFRNEELITNELYEQLENVGYEIGRF